MKNETSTSYNCPNRLGRILLLAMEEIIGRNGVNAVLNQAKLRNRINNYPKNTMDKSFRFDETSQIMVAFEASYGVRGGRGLALRIGRACFKHILHEYGPEMGFTDLAFRTLPLDEKIQKMVDTFAEVFNKSSDQLVTISDSGDRYLWTINRCPFCWHRRAEESVCLLPAGLLQEALYWVSGGIFFSIEEAECIAKGDGACVIVIDKQPLD
jgi:predicted hydrocarbon binding protein